MSSQHAAATTAYSWEHSKLLQLASARRALNKLPLVLIWYWLALFAGPSITPCKASSINELTWSNARA